MKNCGRCDSCKCLNAQDGWEFYGCFHEPYNGKWIAEIEECPKDEYDGNADEEKPFDIFSEEFETE